MNLKRAVFLDRDGTLIEEREYLSRPEDVALFKGSAQALKKLRDAGWRLFLVTNQSGVGRGYFSMAEVAAVHERLTRDLAGQHVQLDKIYIAPEAPEAPSRGRKPLPQFLFDARDEFGIDLARSYIIGDKMSDLECGWNAGVEKSILVRTGYGRKLEQSSGDKLANALVVDDLPAAVDWILERHP